MASNFTAGLILPQKIYEATYPDLPEGWRLAGTELTFFQALCRAILMCKHLGHSPEGDVNLEDVHNKVSVLFNKFLGRRVVISTKSGVEEPALEAYHAPQGFLDLDQEGQVGTGLLRGIGGRLIGCGLCEHGMEENPQTSVQLVFEAPVIRTEQRLIQSGIIGEVAVKVNTIPAARILTWWC